MAVSESAQPSQFDALSDYERRHLVHHLLAAGREDDLHALLALETPNSRNAWFEFLRDHDEMNGFVSDIGRCKQAALERGEEAIPLAIRYALIGASMSSQAAAIAPELLEAMVQAQVLSCDHGLTIARENSDPAQRRF